MLNGRTLGDTVGNLTSFQHNGCSTVDYCIFGDFTVYSDHYQITTCFSFNHFVTEHKFKRKPPRGIKWSNDIATVFQTLIVSENVGRLLKNCLSCSRDLNKTDINDATKDITSIYQNINSSLKAHFHSKTETRKFKKSPKRKKKGFD